MQTILKNTRWPERLTKVLANAGVSAHLALHLGHTEFIMFKNAGVKSFKQLSQED